MKSADLHKVWSAPDNSRLTAKQQSFRLPIHVAAKINALCEVFPNKTKTEIVGDLLTAALDEVIAHLPSEEGTEVVSEDEHDRTYEDVGPRGRFQTLANRHYKELERELGNKHPSDLYSGKLCVRVAK